MNIFQNSFLTFLRIGLFTIGGGYAMIPLIEDEVVHKKKWLLRDEFYDLVAVAQGCPGIFAVNISIFVGYKLRGFKGSLSCAFGTILPSFFIILCIALFFQRFGENEVVQRIFKGIRPAVVALIAAPVFRMSKTANINRWNCYIPVLAAVLIWQFGISPVLVVAMAGVGGFAYGRFIRPFIEKMNGI